MKVWRWLAGVAGLACAIAASPALHAEPPAPAASTPRTEHQERRRQRLERLLAQRSAAPSAIPSSPPVPSAAGSAWLPELSRRWAEVAATRDARREKHRTALVREVGARLQEPAVRAELALHSQRVAELARLEFLAKNARSGEQRDKLIGRIQKLQAQEAARHRRILAKLAPAAASAAPAPSASGEAKP